MRELNNIEVSNVSGGNPIVKEVVKWLAANLSWEGTKKVAEHISNNDPATYSDDPSDRGRAYL